MPKIKQFSNGDLLFFCPGCGHRIRLSTKIWQFDGNLEKPTITPSIKSWIENKEDGISFMCHSFITNGKIQFLSDCTHELKDQTVDLPDLENFELSEAKE